MASTRAKSNPTRDPEGFSEAALLHKALPRLLLSKTKPAGYSFVTWANLVHDRAQRFLSGQWQALWNESAPAVIGLSRKPELSNEMKEVVAELRAFDGDLSGCVQTLESGKLLLASNSSAVVNEWSKKVNTPGRRATSSWQDRARAKGLDPSDSRFSFKLDKSEIAGPDGPMQVDTLIHVMAHLPKRAGGGIDGNGFGVYSTMDTESVRPFVEFFVSGGVSGGCSINSLTPLGKIVRLLLVSGLGVGLDKKGFGNCKDLRPLGCRDSLARIAARCITLQTKGNDASLRLAQDFQCGVGLHGGLDIGYSIPNRVLDILTKNDVPTAMLVTDGGNAYSSLRQDVILDKLVVERPDLVNFWSCCYGGEECPFIVLDNGSRIDVTSIFQGCGLSPEFFALGIKDLITTFRSEVKQISGVEPTVSAYLDDINALVPLEYMFESIDILRSNSPEPYGIHFDDIVKNLFYVPKRFQPQLLQLITTVHDRRVQICDDESLGALTRAAIDLKSAAEQDEIDACDFSFVEDDSVECGFTIKVKSSIQNKPPCLVSLVGVERVLGAPFRVIDTYSEAADVQWLKVQVNELSRKAVAIFAHLGIESVDSLGCSLVDDPSHYVTNVPKVSEPQIQSLLTSYCFATKLSHLARLLPPEIVVPSLEKLEKMQVAVYSALTSSGMGNQNEKRAIMPRRFGGVVPGVSPVAEAAFVAGANVFENFIHELVQRKKSDPLNANIAFGVQLLVNRFAQRETLVVSNELSAWEARLKLASDSINEAASDHPVLASRKPTSGIPNSIVLGGVIDGPAAAALERVGGARTMVVPDSDLRPVPFQRIHVLKLRQHDLANFLWIRYFNRLYVHSNNRDRLLLDEGATAGSGLFLQGIPSSANFRFSPQVFTTQLRSYLGLSPAPKENWSHICSNGEVHNLHGNQECSHLYHCNQQGRSIAVHAAVLDQLKQMLNAAEYGHGWSIEQTLENPEAPLHLRHWRADLVGYDPKGKCVLIDAHVKCLVGSTALQSRSEEALNRSAAVLRDAELTKERDPKIQASLRARNASFVPFVLSSNGALGEKATSFLKSVFKHVKSSGLSSMRSSHPYLDSTWSTTWFSTFWRQRISSAITATNASYVDRILRADVAASQFRDGQTASSHGVCYYYDPNRSSREVVYRGMWASGSSPKSWGWSKAGNRVWNNPHS